MQTVPEISVIMPCYNAEKTLNDSIASVVNQTFKNFEIIAINDGSTDDTLKLLKKLSKTNSSLTIINQANNGCGAARNSGLKIAKGEFIAFLDADDTWHPEFLEKLLGALKADTDAVLAYCGWQNIGLQYTQPKPYIPIDYETSDKILHLLKSCPWPVHAALTYKFTIIDVGLFNENLKAVEDYDLWLKIASFNKIVLVPEVLSYYHHYDNNMQMTSSTVKIATTQWIVKNEFVKRNPDILENFGQEALNIMNEDLLRRAYTAYWRRDLLTAHTLFRILLRKLQFRFKDLKYILPTILPYSIYKKLTNLVSSQ